MALSARFADELQPDDDADVVVERAGRLITADQDASLLAGVERIQDIVPARDRAATASASSSSASSIKPALRGTRGVLDFVVRQAGAEKLGVAASDAPSPFKRPLPPASQADAPSEAPVPAEAADEAQRSTVPPADASVWGRVAGTASALFSSLLRRSLPPARASGVRALAWHCNQPILALATCADEIRLYRLPGGQPSPAHLKHERQLEVRCLAWKPLGNYIAAGTRDGACVWRVDLQHAFPSAGGPGKPASQGFGKIVPTADGGRATPAPSAGLAALLPTAAPVTSLAWCPTGEWQLATASAADGSVVLWDVAEGRGTALRRLLLAGPGATLVSWAPGAEFLLAAFSDGTVRVWECVSWLSESISLPAPATSAMWTAGGKTVVLAAGVTLHSMSFSRAPSGVVVRMGRDDYCGEAPIQTRSGEIRTVGGAVRLAAADGRGERVALAFEGAGSRRLALFSVSSPQPFTDFLPIGAAPLAAGGRGELQELAFASAGVKASALLALAWSNGSVSFLPFA
eukprot:tig00000691_g3169.t1